MKCYQQYDGRIVFHPYGYPKGVTESAFTPRPDLDENVPEHIQASMKDKHGWHQVVVCDAELNIIEVNPIQHG
jgi:hypothetical protein